MRLCVGGNKLFPSKAHINNASIVTSLMLDFLGLIPTNAHVHTVSLFVPSVRSMTMCLTLNWMKGLPQWGSWNCLTTDLVGLKSTLTIKYRSCCMCLTSILHVSLLTCM